MTRSLGKRHGYFISDDEEPAATKRRAQIQRDVLADALRPNVPSRLTPLASLPMPGDKHLTTTPYSEDAEFKPIVSLSYSDLARAVMTFRAQQAMQCHIEEHEAGRSVGAHGDCNSQKCTTAKTGLVDNAPQLHVPCTTLLTELDVDEDGSLDSDSDSDEEDSSDSSDADHCFAYGGNARERTTDDALSPEKQSSLGTTTRRAPTSPRGLSSPSTMPKDGHELKERGQSPYGLRPQTLAARSVSRA